MLMFQFTLLFIGTLVVIAIALRRKGKRSCHDNAGYSGSTSTSSCESLTSVSDFACGDSADSSGSCDGGGSGD